jgi:hypothetical protein
VRYGGGPSWHPSRCCRHPSNSPSALGARSSLGGARLPIEGEPRWLPGPGGWLRGGRRRHGERNLSQGSREQHLPWPLVCN